MVPVDTLVTEREKSPEAEPVVPNPPTVVSISPAPVSGAPIGDFNVIGIGQSNMEIYFRENAFGKKYFESNLSSVAKAISGRVEFINSAFGGSSVLQENANAAFPKNYWAVMTSDGNLTAGPRLIQTITKIRELRAAGEAIEMFLWAQGEADAVSIETRARKASNSPAQQTARMNADLLRYRKGLDWVITTLQREAGSASTPFGIQALGRRVSASMTHIGVHKVRQIQNEVSASNPSVKVLAQMYDAPLKDSVHLNEEGQRLILDRLMLNIDHWLAKHPLRTGPRVTSARIADSKRAVHVQLDSKFSILMGNQSHLLFAIVDKNYNVIARPISAALLNPKTITVRFAEPLSKDHKLVVAFGMISDGGTTGKSLKAMHRYINDSTGFPLQPSEVNLD